MAVGSLAISVLVVMIEYSIQSGGANEDLFLLGMVHSRLY